MLTGVTIDTVCLTMIFGYFMVNEAYNVWTNRGFEDCWETDWGLSSITFFGINRDERTCRGQRLKLKQTLKSKL